MLELPARDTLAYVCHDMQNDYLKEGGRTPEASLLNMGTFAQVVSTEEVVAALG